jgi:hypothetical protein
MLAQFQVLFDTVHPVGQKYIQVQMGVTQRVSESGWDYQPWQWRFVASECV